MNDDELDLWLSTQNERFDTQINAKISVELRRQQVRSATTSGPVADEPDIAEVHTTWSEQTDPTGPRSRRGRPLSVGGLVRRSLTRPASNRPAKRSSTHLGPSVPVARYKRKFADATRSSAAILMVILCLLVPSAVKGDLVDQWGVASRPHEQSKSMVIGLPADVVLDTHRYGFSSDLANWLADDLHYSPTTFHRFYDLYRFPDYYRKMLRSGQLDMVITPKPVTGQRETEALFAGPYMMTQGGMMIRADNTAIRTIGDLDGKRVCTWSESTYKEESMRLGNSVPIEKDDLPACLIALMTGEVDAVAGDQILLSRIAKTEDVNKLSVVPGLNFGGKQRYGIELEHDNVSECNEIREAIRRFITSGAWDHAFQANIPDLPPAAFKPDPDRLDRCE